MKQAMSCGLASNAWRAAARASRSAASTSSVPLIDGAAMRGQSNFGNRATFLGSVLVSDIV